MSRPFNTALRRGPDDPRDLVARVDAEIRDRLGEAVDFACLESMVSWRRTRGQPPPAADNARDRAEFDRRVETFLGRLADAMVGALDAEQQRTLAEAGRAAGDRLGQLIAVQVVLAKRLPDYWQRFEQIRDAHAAEADDATAPSGRDRPGWLERILGR